MNIFSCVVSSAFADTPLCAITGVSQGANQAVPRRFPWNALDVGTAQGDLITQGAFANPYIEGIGFDLPEVGPIFEEYAEANGISGRVKFLSWEFPGTGDAQS